MKNRQPRNSHYSDHSNHVPSRPGNDNDDEWRMPCCVPEGEVPDYCIKASEEAAAKAVKKTFAILGVDIDSPESVENFRKDLRFGARMRKYVDHGTLVFTGAVAIALTYALFEGIVVKIKDLM